MEAPLLILLFFGVIAITAVLFVLWTIFSIFAWMFRGVATVAGHKPSLIVSPPMICPQTSCQLPNPAGARFCRRCGQSLLTSTLSRGTHAALMR